MKKVLVIFIALMALSACCKAQAADFTCTQMKKEEAWFLKHMPLKIDKHTKLVGVKVDCDNRLISYEQRASYYDANFQPMYLPKNFEEVVQLNYLKQTCTANGLPFKGWSLINTTHLISHYRDIVTISNKQMCKTYLKYNGK